jgi:hypothetical protein
VRLPNRILAMFGGLAVAASLGGCTGDEPPGSAPAAAPAQPTQPKGPAPEPAIKDMKPADPKPSDSVTPTKIADGPPPLVPPSGAKDEMPDAKPR